MKRIVSIILILTMLVIIVAGCSQAEDKNTFMSLREEHKSEIIKRGPVPGKSKELNTPNGASLITYESGELKLKGWISENKEENIKKPAIVFVHGGFSLNESYWDLMKPYMDAGYVVMTPMVRGEKGNDGNYELLYGEVDDIIAAGEYVSKLSYVDEKNIYLVGHSLGGATSILASMMPSKYKSVITFGAAPLDIKGELDANEQLKNIIPFNMDNEIEFSLRTPIKYADSVQKPLYMFVESNSHIPNLKELTESFSKEVNEKGGKSEIHIVEGNHLSAIEGAVKKSIDIINGN
ncbi:alpha/beta hydrolase family protein [Anaeromicrobium sediminis]|uniref:Peptidase S9 prolyl oligopeptidase catalytic domain-containing protein n=1 Tax=Anaeromicrobium sediminis TaxID=1478221 RepID=A0A267MK77_9FIRM|nr:alpha/beta fold hydrolase [Anaeromicrobium sediminis]PAB60001.1 hypothetical protein CCE28_06400 [Anaeromicrobium sediminis]